jgi:ribosome-associated protein
MKTPILTKLAVAALEDLKAQDIRVLDVKHVTTVTDAMIVCTGTSNRHVKSLAQNVVDKAKENGVRPLGVEGLDQGEWALVDLNGVVVHVMQAQARVFYQLEKLWDVPPPVVAPTQAGKAPGARRGQAQAQVQVQDQDQGQDQIGSQVRVQGQAEIQDARRPQGRLPARRQDHSEAQGQSQGQARCGARFGPQGSGARPRLSRPCVSACWRWGPGCPPG